MSDHWEPYDSEIRPPYIQGQYDRLREKESGVLSRYLSETGTDNIDRLRTGVPVGEGEIPGMPQDRWERQVKSLSMWKIDAVVDRPGQQEVIELKSRGTHTAVGQALAYDLALGERDDEPTSSKPVVAAFRVHPDLPAFARMVGVGVHTVPQADTSSATRRFERDLRRFRSRDRDNTFDP